MKSFYEYKNLSVTILVLCFLAMSLQSVLAVPRGGEATWNKQGAGGLGNVNLFTGNLNANVPLVTLGGRGGIQIPLQVRLTERQWYKWLYYRWNPDMPGIDSSGCLSPTRRELSPGMQTCGVTNPGDPWLVWVNPKFASEIDLGYKVGKLVARTQIPTNVTCSACPPGTPNCNEYSFKPEYSRTVLTFYAPDGSSHELVDKATSGAYSYHGGGNSNYSCSGRDYLNRGTEYVTRDSTGMRFISDFDYSSYDAEYWDEYGNVEYGVPGASGVLYMPDGSRFRFDGGDISWIKDRNGNITSFTYSSGRLQSVTDSLGRTVSIEYDIFDEQPYGLSDHITYKTIGGIDQIIRVSKDDLANVLAAGETIKQYHELFPARCGNSNSTCTSSADFTTQVTSKVWYPDGKHLTFKYTSFAEIARIEYPSGSAEEFSHEYLTPNVSDYERYTLSRKVTERRLFENAASPSSLVSKTKYSRAVVNNGAETRVTVDETDPNDSLLSRTISSFLFHSGAGFQPGGLDYSTGPHYNEGFLYSVENYGNDGTTLISRNLREQTNRLSGPYAIISDPRVTTETSIYFENGNALATLSRTEYDETGSSDSAYFSHLNVKRKKNYLLKPVALNTATTGSIATISGLFSESDLASVTESDYLYDPTYNERSINGLVTETRVLNPTNTSDVLAKSQFVYDEATYFDNNYTTTGWVDPGSNLRGNVTTARTWNKDTNTWIESHTMFDNFGNVRKVWDTSGDPTRFIESEYDPVYKYAYSTKTKAPAPDPTGVHGTTEGSEISRVYDFTTGLLLSVTDANGQTATTEYDALLRPIRINPPAGGSVSETIYNDTPGNIWVKSRQQIDANNWAESTTYFDNLGRAYKSRTKDLQGDVMSQVRFDSFGRVEKTSNPYRVDASGNPTETVYWSKPRYDEQNRVVETFAPAPDGQTGMSLGTVQFGISTLQNLIGTYVVSTDASGRKSRAISGIYGLMRVDEATGKGGTIDQDLGPLASPTQPTYYSYNVKGEMTKITQGDPNQQGQPIQHRYFMYDSFGRLIRVRQPEQTPNANLATSGNPDNNQWTAGYTYDVFGNVVSVTDAKNITITNFYDKASRTTKRTYSDSTPQVEYFYDGKGLPQVPQFSKGSLTKVTSSVSEDRFTSFDNHGRLLTSEQITDGQVYPFTYKYNLSGGLTEQTYPSGRIVRNFLDTDGGLSSVTTIAAGGLLKQVASDFDYSATGGVRKMKIGNGLWETADVNHLNQLTQVGLGTTATNKNLFRVDYEYGELNTDGTTVDANKNIGMIAKTTTSIPTTSFVQTFKYDSINRLTEAVEKTGTTQNWKQTFGYDRFGNRTNFYQIVGSTELPTNNITKPTIDQANNRFTTGQGYTYDLNGNLIEDAQGRSFTFNGDDKQTVVRDLSIPVPPMNPDANVIGRYFYDGSGARVKKVTNTETTVFVYDAGGALTAEYSTQTPPSSPTTSYLTTDHLGSPRVITDDNGEVIARRDFMPFGEELGAGVGLRTESLKYSYLGSDRVRQRFTGYEKDDETQLDFAEARMYQNKHGRFTAPDPLLASASATDPQTFNRYTYTGNDPINRTDPSGLTFCKSNSTGMIDWNGEIGKPCGDGYSSVDNQEITMGNRSSGNDSHGNKITPGSTVRFNADGTTRVIRTSAQNQATVQGQSVAATTSNTPGQTAAEAATSNAATVATDGASASGSGGGASGFLSLPCSSGLTCKIETQAIDLTIGASAEDIKTSLDVVGMSEIPIVSQAADITSGVISFSQGDTVGGVLSVGAAAPLIGTLFTAAKWGRRGVSALDYAREAGRAGEAAAGITGPKRAINVGGRNLFPDDVTDFALTEVKNVKKLSYTRQLRDYNKYTKAHPNKLDFILVTRPGTKLSGPLRKAIERGDIIHRPILPF